MSGEVLTSWSLGDLSGLKTVKVSWRNQSGQIFLSCYHFSSFALTSEIKKLFSSLGIRREGKRGEIQAKAQEISVTKFMTLGFDFKIST